MKTRSTFPGAVTTMLLCCSMMLACDEAQLHDGNEFTQFPYTHHQSTHALVSASGLEALYKRALAQGVDVVSPPEQMEYGELTLRLGPLEHTIESSNNRVLLSDEQVTIQLEFDSPEIIVPIRIYDGIGHQICRYRVFATGLQLITDLAVDHESFPPSLHAAQDSWLEFSNAEVERIGACHALESSGLALTHSPLAESLFEYVKKAVAASAQEQLTTAPLHTLGLLQRRIELHRTSLFENRNGELYAMGQLAAQDPMRLAQHGLILSLDAAVHQRRASCAPPLSVQPRTLTNASEVSPDLLEASQAHVGMALSSSLLQHILQSMVLSGFSCVGLEHQQQSTHGNPHVIATSDLKLEDLQIVHPSSSPWANIVLSPGSLPALNLRAVHNDLELRWDDLMIDVYVEMYQVPVRLLQVRTTAQLYLRPKHVAPGMLGFDIDSVHIEQAHIQSDWSVELPQEQEQLTRWARRLLIISLANRFVLPLPLEPGAPLNMIGAQVREDDVVLFLRVE